jgi:hypothetical protein
MVAVVAGSGLSFEARGEHELKGVPELWRLYRASALRLQHRGSNARAKGGRERRTGKRSVSAIALKKIASVRLPERRLRGALTRPPSVPLPSIALRLQRTDDRLP